MDDILKFTILYHSDIYSLVLWYQTCKTYNKLILSNLKFLSNDLKGDINIYNDDTSMNRMKLISFRLFTRWYHYTYYTRLSYKLLNVGQGIKSTVYYNDMISLNKIINTQKRYNYTTVSKIIDDYITKFDRPGMKEYDKIR